MCYEIRWNRDLRWIVDRVAIREDDASASLDVERCYYLLVVWREGVTDLHHQTIVRS